MRRETIEDILRIGRQHLADHGAANLSLRAIAREIGLTSSAVYRYVPSRAELLTILVIDAYEELDARILAAHDALAPEDLRGRLRAIGTELRAWAVAEPARYALIYGTPIDDYTQPTDRTDPPCLRIVLLLLRLVQDAEHAGAIAPADLAPPIHDDLAGMRAALPGATASDAACSLAIVTWSYLIGWVSSEVFDQFAVLQHPEALFLHQLGTLADTLGLPG
jgi:AcrR family transcriptional regulator